jgi:hypothetical protein
VAGLTGGATAQVRIEAAGESVVLRSGDARCTVVRTVATCQVSGDTSVAVEVVAPQGGSVAATVSPSGSDADGSNNTWRAVLG